MALINRIEDLIKSELNAFLDKAEDPQKMLSQIQIELQEALSECRATAAELLAEQRGLARKRTDLHKQVAYWQGKAELALTKNREDLAKAALSEKQKTNDTIAELEKQSEQLETSLEKLNEDAARLSGKLEQLRQKQAQFERSARSIEAQLQARTVLNSDNVKQVCQRFDELEQKVERIEAQVESYELGSNSVEQQFKTLEQDEKLEEELAQLKAQVQQKKAS